VLTRRDAVESAGLSGETLARFLAASGSDRPVQDDVLAAGLGERGAAEYMPRTATRAVLSTCWYHDLARRNVKLNDRLLGSG